MQNRTAQRISLSLSPEAYSIVISDMDVFQNVKNLDGFINRIIANYKDTADASISLAKEREREKYINWIKSVSGDTKISTEDSACLDRLIEGYTRELTLKMNSFKNGESLKPRIKNGAVWIADMKISCNHEIAPTLSLQKYYAHVPDRTNKRMKKATAFLIDYTYELNGENNVTFDFDFND